MWECHVWLMPSTEGTINEIVIADLSEDLVVATRHYSDVHGKLHALPGVGHLAWVGIQLDPVPPGFKILARQTVKVISNLQPKLM